ncbi:MAG TPA: alpha/beta hydrolase [Sphingopyxis sp.]|uniref:alpha/beta fold hydrolase n=1 Tax=Sphingopyxis sp. TaxID=1908224 RepID=UPI002C0A929C|nr:alpha/beta hydrolase [Sphingopyxis sp.]HWW55728.1 alpha/beta hydrolase [Sphingopyxis sp.]
MAYRPTFPSFDRRAPGSPIVMAALAAAILLAAAPRPLHARTQAPATAAAAAKTGYADVDGARIHYQVYGDLASGRTPLLVLHGAFMSGDAMGPLIAPLAATRPVIAIDARGHGRTGDAPGGLSYDRMANDADGVLAALKVEKADVLGYSMGAATALRLAMLHPGRIGKQVIISGAYRLDGMPPELIKNIASLTPEIFAGSPIESGYKKTSPTPDAFPTLVNEIKALDAADFAWPEDEIRAIKGKTMVIAGDNDGTTLEHTIALFKLRGGYDLPTILQGFMTEAPKARLAILPATSHIGIMAEAPGIAAMVTPFLDDKAPPPPPF